MVDLALAQLPTSASDQPVLVRSDSAGASTQFAWHLRERSVGFSVGMQIDAHVREAVLAQPEAAWTLAIDANGQVRHGARVCELTGWVDMHTWLAGTRGDLPPRGRPPPARSYASPTMTATASRVFLTDQPDRDLACLELRHWPRARVEDRIRAAKATGLGQPLPFDRGSGATAAGGGVQRADRGDLIPSGSCHLSLPWVDRTQHRPCEQPASVHMGSTPWIPRSATCSVHRCRPSTEAHGACLDQLTIPPREPLGPMWPASAAPASLLAADRDSRRQHHPPNSNSSTMGIAREREAPADFLANRDMSRNGLGFAVSLRQEPPRLVDLEGANGAPE